MDIKEGCQGRSADKHGRPYLLPHLPHALHTIEHVAAPQQLAANPINCSPGQQNAH
jgi:hypothetical protein